MVTSDPCALESVPRPPDSPSVLDVSALRNACAAGHRMRLAAEFNSIPIMSVDKSLLLGGGRVGAGSHQVVDTLLDQCRYTDVLPTPATRVQLSRPLNGTIVDEFINANYITAATWVGDHGQTATSSPSAVGSQPRTRRYIATQGPLTSTTGDFWRMIWEQNCTVIVMMTGLVERGRDKCARYWPAPGSPAQQHGDFLVECVGGSGGGGGGGGSASDVNSRNHSEGWWQESRLWLRPRHSSGAETVMASMSSGGGAKIEGEGREIRHFWYTNWPDHGAPINTAPILSLCATIRDAAAPGVVAKSTGPAAAAPTYAIEPGTMAPIVVHCSAGIGRTGTFICVAEGMQSLSGPWRVCDVRSLVANMRCERGGMVQTPVQYEFIHKALRDYMAVPAAVATLAPTLTAADEADSSSSTARVEFGKQQGLSFFASTDRGRTVTLSRTSTRAPLGMTIRGSRPVFVSSLTPGAAAYASGIRVGDQLLALEGAKDFAEASHDAAVLALAAAGANVRLHVLSPKG